MDSVKKLKTHCKHGHEFTKENTLINRKGYRVCIACANIRRDSRERRPKPTKEEVFGVSCPVCGIVRGVGKTTYRRHLKSPRPCISCSRKMLRKGMEFKPRFCAKCGSEFSGRSGSAKYCVSCTPRRKVFEPKECPVCKRMYTGYANRMTCSSSCRRRLSQNESYFGGRLFQAEGWDDKVCRICDKFVPQRFHVHHVFGHPDHSRLVVLCPGCHNAVSKLAHRANFGDENLRRVIYFVRAQRDGREPKPWKD